MLVEKPHTQIVSDINQSNTLIRLIKAFEHNDVTFLDWKAGDNTSGILSGIGDIDLLIKPGDFERAEQVMSREGFQKIRNAAWRYQPFVFDWYGADNKSGQLLHVQLYQKLILGSAFSWQLDVPGSEYLFATAKSSGAPHSDATAAAVLLVSRAAIAGKYLPGRSADQLLGEASRLTEGYIQFTDTAAQLFDPDTAQLMCQALQSGSVGNLRNSLLKRYASSQPAGGQGWFRHAETAVAKLNRRYTRWPILVRRKLATPAPVVAVIGSDGSGKSTVSSSLSSIIDKKIDTRLIYFGTGDGPASLIRKPLLWLRKLSQYDSGTIQLQNTKDIEPMSPSSGQKEHIPDIAKAAWAISVAWERNAKMRKVRRASKAGIVVITDRYPQVEFPGIHDGPRLGEWLETKKNGPALMLARWEQQVYQRLVSRTPDLVLLLDVSPELAAKRRPEASFADLQKRIMVARELHFQQAERVVLDASDALPCVIGRSLHEVLIKMGRCL